MKRVRLDRWAGLDGRTGKVILRVAIGVLALASLPAAAWAQTYDVVIRNGRVIDGRGNPWYRADVAIAGDRVAAMGDLEAATGTTEVDATGLYVVPGFIDTHSHAAGALATPELSHAEPLLAQGITMILGNPDGGGPADLAEQKVELARDGLGVNVGLMVPHGSVRREVMGTAGRLATDEELERMRDLVRAGMEEGAFGISTGPFYVPGSYSDTDELVEVSRVAAEYGGTYASHIRDESSYSIGLLAAVEEVITIGRETGMPAVWTHAKALGPTVWGFSAPLVHRIEQARAEGVEVYGDQYPYDASATSLGAALVPRWAQADGGFDQRMADSEQRARILSEMRENLARRGGADRIQFRRYRPDPGIEGMTLAGVADRNGLDPIEQAIRLLAEGGASIVSFNMHEDDMERLMVQPWMMTASDGDLVAMGSGVPHPRNYGTFPRKIRRYVLDEGVVSLEAAVRSMTTLPAQVYRLPDRGGLAAGAIADIAVFDLETITDVGTFSDPHHLSEGVIHVWVNGRPAVRDGVFTGERAGRVLTRER